MVGDPLAVNRGDDRVALDTDGERLAGDILAATAEQHRETQTENGHPLLTVANQRLRFAEFAVVRQYEQGQACLVYAGEARHIGMMQDIGAVLVVTSLRDRHANLMKIGSPG